MTPRAPPPGRRRSRGGTCRVFGGSLRVARVARGLRGRKGSEGCKGLKGSAVRNQRRLKRVTSAVRRCRPCGVCATSRRLSFPAPEEDNQHIVASHTATLIMVCRWITVDGARWMADCGGGGTAVTGTQGRRRRTCCCCGVHVHAAYQRETSTPLCTCLRSIVCNRLSPGPHMSRRDQQGAQLSGPRSTH